MITALTKHQDIGWWFVPFGDEWLFGLSERRDAWSHLERKLRMMGFWEHQIAMARMMLQYPRVAQKQQAMPADYSMFERSILATYYAEAERIDRYTLSGKRRRFPSDDAFVIATAHLRQAKERLR